jgi:ABC-type microcin C transport system permease subunit YejE
MEDLKIKERGRDALIRRMIGFRIPLVLVLVLYYCYLARMVGLIIACSRAEGRHVGTSLS